MVEIVLYQPEIPPNTGNVIRLAANTGARLHLVGPLGFSLEDRALRRAGLDYHDLAAVSVHRDWAACAEALAGRRMFVLTTRGRRNAFDARFAPDDVLIFSRSRRSSGNSASRVSGTPAVSEPKIRTPL